MQPNQWDACPVLLNTQNCLSGKYSPTPLPETHTPGAHRPKCMFRVVLVSCQARFWEEAVSAVRFFFFISLCKSYSPRKTSRSPVGASSDLSSGWAWSLCATHCRPGRPPSLARGHSAACVSAGEQGCGTCGGLGLISPTPRPRSSL